MTDVDLSVTPTAPAVAPPADGTVSTAAEGTVSTEKPEGSEGYATKEDFEKAFQKRLTRESRRLEKLIRAETEATYYKQLHEQGQKPVQQVEGPPKAENFKTYEEYLEAVTDWKVEQRMKGFEQKFAENNQQREQQTSIHRQAAEVAQKLGEYREKYPDFDEVAYSDDVPITKAMAQAIAESDVSGDVAYFLGSNIAEAARISKLPATQQIREIAKLEAKLKAGPKPSQTPPPIAPSAGTASGKKSLSDMNYDEFVAARRKGQKS